jgi:hypothetical protein
MLYPDRTRRTTVWLLGLGLVCALSGASLAATEGNRGKTTVGVLLFTHWGLDLSEGAEDFNAFDVDRVYTTVRHAIDEDLSLRVTTDIGRGEGPDDTKLRLFLKYAYVQWKGFAPGMKLRFGAASTPFVDDSSKFTGIRYISKAMADRHGLMTTSDLGLHIHGGHMDGALSWQASVMNGEGYGAPEVSKGKAIQAKMAYDALSGPGGMSLPITVFMRQEVGEEKDEGAILYGGALGFSMRHAKLWGEYIAKTLGDVESQAISVTLIPRLPGVLDGVIRYDLFDPNTDVEKDGMATLIAGVQRSFARKLSASVTFEQETREDDRKPTVGVYLRVQAGF